MDDGGEVRIPECHVTEMADFFAAHWCTILRSLIFDGSVMRPRCRQVIAFVA